MARAHATMRGCPLVMGLGRARAHLRTRLSWVPAMAPALAPQQERPRAGGTGTCSCHLYPPSTNIPAATSVQVTIHGSSMGSELSTIKARTGGSACESTLWRGTGWVVCKVAQAGHAKTMGLAITVNIGPGIPGTVTEALSFDNPRIYALESQRNGANIKFANLPVLSKWFPLP